MKKALLLLILLTITACKPKAPSITEGAVSTAVAGTMAAQQHPTALPTYTPAPTSPPPTLDGLFCEYQFCIGHPNDLPLFDVRKAEQPSTYAEGMLAAYSPDLFILVIWQPNRGSDDPQFMLDIIMDAQVDTRRGNLDVNLLRDLTTFYTPLNTSATEVLPTGGAGAWICGDRAFAWKAYAPSEEIAKSLYLEAMSKFRCQ